MTLSATAGAFATSPAPPFDQIELGDGDVLQIYSAGDGSDLSGSEILADLPVAVFSGNMTTTYGRSAPGVNSPDMAHEQMPPRRRLEPALRGRGAAAAGGDLRNAAGDRRRARSGGSSPPRTAAPW